MICTGTGGPGRGGDTGKNIIGADVKGMNMKEVKEKEDIGKDGSASTIGRGFSPCLHLSHLRS